MIAGSIPAPVTKILIFMSTEDKELLEGVLSKLEFETCKDMLVKPLPDE